MLVNMVLVGVNNSWCVDAQCKSTEEMKRAIDDCNNQNIEGELAVFSMDVKALYPSLQWASSSKNILMGIKESDLKFQTVNKTALGRYLAVTTTEKEREREQLQDVIPEPLNRVKLKDLGKRDDSHLEEMFSPASREPT